MQDSWGVWFGMILGVVGGGSSGMIRSGAPLH